MSTTRSKINLKKDTNMGAKQHTSVQPADHRRNKKEKQIKYA